MEEKVWGEKTKKAESSMMNRVGVRHLTNQISSYVENSMDDFKFVENNKKDLNCFAEQVDNQTYSFLKELERRDCIIDPKTESNPKYLSWYDLYGLKLPFAWLADKLISALKLPMESSTPKWYHKFLFYTVKKYDIENEIVGEFLDRLRCSGGEINDGAVEELESLIERYINTERYVYKFVKPHYIVETSVKFRPKESQDIIKLDFELLK